MGTEIKLTIWQRLKAETPVFFKKVQIFAVALAGLGGSLAAIHGIPVEWSTILITVGTTAAAVAQFAVKTITGDSGTDTSQQ